MPRSLGQYVANAMTAARVLLTPAFVATAYGAEESRASGWVAVLLFALVAASDVWDGRVARRFGSDSNRGRTFDHFADIIFLLPALCTYVYLGIAPWWVPASIAAAFTFYVVDSRLRTSAGPPSLIGSRVGHVGGVSNFVLVGVLVCNNSAAIQLLSPRFLMMLFALVPLYSGAAVALRLFGTDATRSPKTPPLRGDSGPAGSPAT